MFPEVTVMWIHPNQSCLPQHVHITISNRDSVMQGLTRGCARTLLPCILSCRQTQLCCGIMVMCIIWCIIYICMNSNVLTISILTCVSCFEKYFFSRTRKHFGRSNTHVKISNTKGTALSVVLCSWEEGVMIFSYLHHWV